METNNENKDHLSPKEIYDAKKLEKENVKKSQQTKNEIVKKRKGLGVFVVIGALVIVGGYFSINAIKSLPSLPPTSQQNHVESSPPSHILTSPIPDKVQRHMFEHSDGDGLPGIIIQYNCDDYDCAPDLIEKLTSLVEEYPDNVYLAPNKYDGKVILTREGRIKILEAFDEEVIRDFIGN